MNYIKKRSIFNLVKIAVLILVLYSLYKLRPDKFVIGYYELKKEHILASALKDTLPSEFILIAHAGGGVSGKTYLNTLETINQSIIFGYKFIEIDINLTKDSIYVLSHDFVSTSASSYLAARANGTHLTLIEFLIWLQDKDVKIITDTKINTINVLSIIRQNYPDLVKKIIPQVYSISEINTVRKMGFKNIIFTNYVKNYPFFILMKIAHTKSLYGITMPYNGIILQFLSLTNWIKKSPTPFFAHTINEQRQVAIAQKCGIKGIYTDFILPKK